MSTNKVRSSSATRHAASDDALDVVLRAVADPTRRAMLRRLSAGPATVTELAEPFAMSLPASSKHLRVLESAGLVRREIEGRVHRCSLVTEPLRDVGVWLDTYRGFWEQTLESLARHVAAAPAAPAARKKRMAR